MMRKQRHDSLSPCAARAACSIYNRLRRLAGVSLALGTIVGRTTIGVVKARVKLLRTCTDQDRCCQSNNNSGEGETHFLYEMIWNLLRGLSNDITEDGVIL